MRIFRDSDVETEVPGVQPDVFLAFNGFRNLTIVNLDGPFDPSETAPAALLVNGKIIQAGRDSNERWELKRWYGYMGAMFGGKFAYSSDGRFPSSFPLPIHDRYETAELAEVLSK